MLIGPTLHPRYHQQDLPADSLEAIRQRVFPSSNTRQADAGVGPPKQRVPGMKDLDMPVNILCRQGSHGLVMTR
uniref:Uncharacterized protein n=1 Tax=Daucus carota subsp. sativus TaxID=79200 RepID=A0A175YKD3_DAUCS